MASALITSYPTKHAFKDNNSQGEIIYWERVVLPVDNFRRHVTWCTASVWIVLGTHCSGYSKVSYSYISFIINNEILRFDIPMYDAIGVEVLESDDDADSKKPDYLLFEELVLTDMVTEVSSRHEVHNKVEVFSILKGKHHIHKEGVFEVCQ